MSNLLTLTLMLFGLPSGACSDSGVQDTILANAIESVNITSGAELPLEDLLSVSLGEDMSATADLNGLATITGTPTSYLWKMESGAGMASFSDSSIADPIISFDTDGDYTISLTISNAITSATDEVIVSYKGSKPEATLSGYPEDLNDDTVLDVTVTSTEDGYYYYKVIESDSGTCSDSTGYSSQMLLADKITDDFSALQDGDITLCVVSEDLYGNVQDYLSATSVSWIKSADAPFAVLTKTPDAETNKTSFKVVVSGTDVTDYKFFFGETATTDCSDLASYSASKATSSKISMDVSALSDGELSLCVLAADVSANWQSERAATKYTWIKDTVAPSVNLLGAPSGVSALNPVALTIDSTDNIQSYSYAVGSDSKACKKLTVWSTFKDISVPLSVSLNGQAQGGVQVCIRAKDVAGNVQSKKFADSVSWTMDTIAPATPINFNQNYSAPDFILTWDEGAPMDPSDSFILIRSLGEYPVLQNGVEYSLGHTFDNSSKVVYDSSTDSYTDLGVNSSSYYYYVFAKDENFNYSAPAENILAPAKSYTHYRFYTKSLKGACTTKKNVIETLELRFDDEWKEANFSSATGTIGGLSATVSSNSEHKASTAAYNVFTSAYYRTLNVFTTSAPYNQTADNYIEIQFASAVSLQGMRVKGGFGGSAYKHCGPDEMQVHASSDGSVWMEQSAATLNTDTTAATVTHVWAGHKPDYISVSYAASEIDLAWNQPNASTSGFILVRSETAGAFTPADSTSYNVGAYAGYDILYKGTNLNYKDTDWDNTTDYYYSVFAFDSNVKYSDARSVFAMIQDFSNYHRYYRIFMESLTGPCTARKSLSDIY